MSNQVVSPALTRPEALTVIGVSLALTAIIQKPLLTGKIYGFWTPQQGGGQPFGPFVNNSHFAGLMLMVLPLTLSVMCAGIARRRRRRDTPNGQR